MARQLQWTRYHYPGIKDPSGSNGTHTVTTMAAGATLTRVRFRPMITGSEQVSFGSLGTYAAFGMYVVPQSDPAGYLPITNIADVDWFWWEIIPLDTDRVHSTTDPATIPAWTRNSYVAGERDCKAQRLAIGEPYHIVWSWQLAPDFVNQMAAWGTLGASFGILEP